MRWAERRQWACVRCDGARHWRQRCPGGGVGVAWLRSETAPRPHTRLTETMLLCCSICRSQNSPHFSPQYIHTSGHMRSIQLFFSFAAAVDTSSSPSLLLLRARHVSSHSNAQLLVSLCPCLSQINLTGWLAGWRVFLRRNKGRRAGTCTALSRWKRVFKASRYRRCSRPESCQPAQTMPHITTAVCSCRPRGLIHTA
jgi:hypothetical protein